MLFKKQVSVETLPVLLPKPTENYYLSSKQNSWLFFCAIQLHYTGGFIFLINNLTRAALAGAPSCTDRTICTMGTGALPVPSIPGKRPTG
jgi:hypothetical protein